MAIRFKTIEYCEGYQITSGGGYNCVREGYEDIPIKEWQFQPATLDGTYTIGSAAPTGKFIDVTFPELNLWKESLYTKYKYKVKVTYDNGNDWLTIQSSDLSDDTFSTINIRNTRLNYGFNNLGNLPPGDYTANIHFEAYGIDDGGAEHYVEIISTIFKLKVLEGTDGSSVTTDKEVYNLSFNKSTGILTGDTVITIYSINAVNWINPPFNLSINKNEINGHTQLALSLTSTTQEIGTYTKSFKIEANGISKNVTINLEVIDAANNFDLSHKTFYFVMQKNPSETKNASVNITNPNNLKLSIIARPSFIESAQIIGDTLTFSTVASSTLALGNYSGEIVVQSGSVERTIAITLNVLQALKSDFNGKAYYFALDKNKISMQRTKPNASYVKMHLQMYFNGFGEQYEETQSYDFAYFNGKIDIYPGEEIQDFFIKCKDLKPMETPSFQYKLAIVNIKITEHDDNDTQLSEFQMRNLLFAPGRTPKCFPLFTDHAKRSTVSESIIRINADILMSNSNFDALYNFYSRPIPAFPKKPEVYSVNFIRNQFTAGNNILQTEKVQYIPIPNYSQPIHIFWETQNLVFDWFTAAKKYEKSSEFEHLFNADDNNSEKYGSKKNKTLTLNTGWLLREEIALVDDLISSRVCFIFIDNEWIKAYPTSKKNTLWNSEEHFFQMDLEFKILE